MILLFQSNNIQVSEPHLILNVKESCIQCKLCNSEEKLDVPAPAKELFEKIITFREQHQHSDMVVSQSTNENQSL